LPSDQKFGLTEVLIGAAIVGVGLLLIGNSSSTSAPSSGTSPPVPVPQPDQPPPATPPDPLVQPAAPAPFFDSVLIAPGSNVLLIGDSLAVGMTSSFKSLATASGFVPSAQAVSGTAISYWSPKIAGILQQYSPALTVVSLGTNDSVFSDPTSESGALASLVQAIQTSGSALVWIGPPTMPAKNTLGVPMQIDKVAAMIQAQSPLYFDSRALTIPRGGDGIHPASGADYAAWMQQVWAWMQFNNIIAS
jgi:hypothetical protein